MLSRRFAPSNPGEDMICCEVLTKTELKRKLHEKKKKLKKKIKKKINNETYGCAQVTTGSK